MICVQGTRSWLRVCVSKSHSLSEGQHLVSSSPHCPAMASWRIIKLVVFELLQFAAFSIPTLVIVEQFATAYQSTRDVREKTHYWLIVSCSIAYVASVSLLIWVPVKVLLYKKRHLSKKIKGW